MNTNESIRTLKVVLSMPKGDKPLLAFAKGILIALTGNAAFPSTNPTLATFADDVDAYDKAETLVGTKARGTVEQRNAKRQRVIEDLHHLRDYVQGVVETLASPADATALIVSAGMRVRRVGKRDNPAIRARNAGTSGVVQLQAKAVAHVATYYWQHSLDQTTWIDVPETMQASTVVKGLIPAQRYYFQLRTLTRTGTSDVSQIVSLLVT